MFMVLFRARSTQHNGCVGVFSVMIMMIIHRSRAFQFNTICRCVTTEAFVEGKIIYNGIFYAVHTVSSSSIVSSIAAIMVSALAKVA